MRNASLLFGCSHALHRGGRLASLSETLSESRAGSFRLERQQSNGEMRSMERQSAHFGRILRSSCGRSLVAFGILQLEVSRPSTFDNVNIFVSSVTACHEQSSLRQILRWIEHNDGFFNEHSSFLKMARNVQCVPTLSTSGYEVAVGLNFRLSGKSELRLVSVWRSPCKLLETCAAAFPVLPAPSRLNI